MTRARAHTHTRHGSKLGSILYVTIAAIKLALLNHELQQGLSHTSDALLQTQLEEEVAEQRIEFICPISLIAGSVS